MDKEKAHLGLVRAMGTFEQGPDFRVTLAFLAVLLALLSCKVQLKSPALGKCVLTLHQPLQPGLSQPC